ncbi:MAG: tetratricopeptide repeat protein, partial [Saprospiraceae bacterium]|nr:tetratricopeptide repeat protein [Saprospiraceae bacterium]
STRIGRCYSTLAAFYGRAGMEAENLDCTRKGFDILKNHGSLIERCAAYNQMAFTFSGREQWAEALPLLDTALQLMRASGVLDQLPSIYLNLGNCHRKLQHWSPAQLYLQSAADLADSLRQAHVYAVALLRLSQVAESTGDYANALRLFQQSRTIRDSLFTDEKTRTMQELEVQYQTREKEQQVQLLESRHHAEVQRRNFILALLLLGLALGLWQWRNWRKKLREAQDELHRFAQTLLAKNSRLTELEQALHSNPTPSDQAATAPEITDEPDDAPQEDLYQRHILTESDWTAFKHHFDRSYPGFRQRLRKNFPELTSAEERLFLLLKLNFSSKEAAAMQGISQESIKKNRYRLRKRLGLEHDEGLEGFVRGF